MRRTHVGNSTWINSISPELCPPLTCERACSGNEIGYPPDYQQPASQSRTQSHRWVALATRDWQTILIGRSISYWTHSPCGVHMRGQYEWIRYFFALFCLKICLFWWIFCRFSSEKVVKGLRSWILLGKITGFVMVIIHTLGSLWVSILMGMMAYVLDLLTFNLLT
jgi:hypothetical protein